MNRVKGIKEQSGEYKDQALLQRLERHVHVAIKDESNRIIGTICVYDRLKQYTEPLDFLLVLAYFWEVCSAY